MTYRGATRPYGMGLDQYTAYVAAMAEAGVSKERIVQTIGNAAASAGTHAKDGVDQHGFDYSACTDIHILDLSETEIHKVLLALADHGLCGWWRHTGSFANNQHCHFVYANCHMKTMVQNQIHDFLAHRNGLVGHAIDAFWAANLKDSVAQVIRAEFLQHNGESLAEPVAAAEEADCTCTGEDDGTPTAGPDGTPAS
jgi:hypothetical protein